MQQVDERLYTPQEVADYLQVDIRTVYRWLKQGDMEAIRLQREYRISDSQLREFLHSRSTRRPTKPTDED
jgi:excisionase family DNA binding protein